VFRKLQDDGVSFPAAPIGRSILVKARDGGRLATSSFSPSILKRISRPPDMLVVPPRGRSSVIMIEVDERGIASSTAGPAPEPI